MGSPGDAVYCTVSYPSAECDKTTANMSKLVLTDNYLPGMDA